MSEFRPGEATDVPVLAKGFLIGSTVALLDVVAVVVVVAVDDDDDEEAAAFDAGFESTIGKSITRSGRFISITSFDLSPRSNSRRRKKKFII